VNAATLKSASKDGDAIDASPAGIEVLRASRSLGAGTAFAVAVVATLIGASLNGGWFLALGIPAAALGGWFLGPAIRGDGWSLRPTIAMATLTIGLADAFAVVPAMISSGGGYATQGVDPISAVAFVLLSTVVTWLLGLVIVGFLSLAVTIPCAVIWALFVRSLIRQGIGVIDDGQRSKS